MSTFRRKAAAALTVLDRSLPAAGLDVPKIRRTIRGVPGFVKDYRDFRSQAEKAGFPSPTWESIYPVIGDDAKPAGAYDSHYLYQDLWAARKLFANRPPRHYDVGSRVDGFITSALVFCPDIVMLDVRPLPMVIAGLSFQEADATKLPFADSSVDSLSSLHAIEHFGLGRYGDAVDAAGSWLALSELARVSAPGGRVYLGLPVGATRVMFNAHRILAPSLILEAVKPLRLENFSAVTDDGNFLSTAEPADFEHVAMSCGLFELTKDD